MNTKLYKVSLTLCAAAAALGLSGCQRDRAAGEPSATGTSGRVTSERYASAGDLNVSGCLQKTAGIPSDYILTQTSSPAESVGTSGTLGTVEGRDLDAAARSYRLSAGGQSNRLRNLVGHQVRVMGTIVSHGTIATDARAASPDNPPDLTESDLARLNVTTVEDIADVCVSGPSVRGR
jgi:hypothetical protein